MIPVVVCVFVNNGKILAEKRPEADEIDPGNICFPAGHVEGNEDLEEALKREMKEELEIEVKKFSFFKKLIYKTGEKSYDMHYFVCTKWNGDIRSNEEIGKLIWLDKKDVDKFDYEEDVKIAKEVIDRFG